MRYVLLCAVVAAALALAPSAAAKVRYCSPTGDFCTSVAKLRGVRYLRIGTFSFTGRVKICVRDPSSRRICHGFRLRKAGPLYQVKIVWKRHYPNRGSGIYRVTFFLGTTKLGPTLSFTQP